MSDLPYENAAEVLAQMKNTYPNSQCAKRDENYMSRRYHYEEIVRNFFDTMGGKRTRNFPHYMVVEHCDWLYQWFEQPAFVKIPIAEFDVRTLSFTYGDMHPTFSPIVTDGKEYRKRLYDYNGILDIISRYGLPQQNKHSGEIGYPYYVEVQVWSDEVVKKYCDEVFREEI